MDRSKEAISIAQEAKAILQGELSILDSNYASNLAQLGTSISDKIKDVTFTASVNNTSTIVHNLTYDPVHDDLLVFYNGVLLNITTNYNNSGDNKSILLVDWSINSGEKVFFKLYKNIR